MGPWRIVDAADPVSPGRALVDEARRLFREYAASLPFSLEYQGFDDELRRLPGAYAPPRGCLLLALSEPGPAVGCVALRPIRECPESTWAAGSGELKRLYVTPSARGRGLARRMCLALLGRARGAGYTRVVLDSSAELVEAAALYRSLGFRPCPRFNDDPDPATVYLALDLPAHASADAR